MRLRVALALAVSALVVRALQPQNIASQHAGPLPGGGYLLNTGWTIRPAGDQVPLDTFPMRSAISSDGKYLLALNGGLNPPSISVVDVAAKKELGRTPLPDAWLGLAAAPSGNVFYVGGGSTGKVFELSLAENGTLTRGRDFTVSGSNAPGAPFVGDVALSPDGRVLYAADLYGDGIAQINLQSGKVVDHWKTGRRPYRIVVSPNGAQLLITSWPEAAVYEHESGTGVLIRKLRVGLHPTDMLWIDKPFTAESTGAAYAGRLFVAASNTNTVFAFGVTQDGQLTGLDPVNVSMTPMHPLGMTPSALASDARGRQLYVACSDANVVAVADISAQHPLVLGFIPTASYPTAVRSGNDGQLIVLNGDAPGAENSTRVGSAEFVPQPDPAHLEQWTRTSSEASAYRDDLIYGPITDQAAAFFAQTKEHASPVQHIIYVVKGSASYDAVLGDVPNANGERSRVRFGDAITPNLHALARQFVTYDNFYSNSSSIAEGQNWAAAAIVPDYTARLWASASAGRNKIRNFEGGEPANTPPAGYLWSNALQAGLTVRNYGEWVTNIPAPQAPGQKQVQSVRDGSLTAVTDLNYRGPDTSYKDVDRTAEFLREWKSFDANGQAPQLSIVRLANGAVQSGAADNDRAVGLLVDAVSHSRVWPSTAIFVVEACSEKGVDHVSDYRSPVWVISPYTRRAAVDSSLFNQASVLRTVELILGMRPFTQFDAAAKPMFGSFSESANAQPFTAKFQP